MSRRARRWLYVLAGLTGLLLILIASAVLILPSDWFREKVRARIVYEVERASGGRVEVGAFRFDWTNLTAEVAPFVLHGTEPAGAAPLFRAESVQVGLKIVSLMKKDVDIESVHVDQPQVNILVDENGITNFPRPKIQRRNARDPIEQLVALAIRNITLRNGTLHYADEKIPLDVRGRYLTAKLSYNFNGPSYQGDLSMDEMTIDPGPALPMTFAFRTQVALHPNRVTIREGRLAMKDTSVDVSGFVEDFKNPHMEFDVRGTGALAELGKPLRLPIEHRGSVSFNGKFTYDRENRVRLTGRMTGQHLAWREGRVNLDNLSMAADVDLDPDQVRLRDVTVHALDGVFRGSVDLANFRTFKADGTLTGVSVRSLTRMAGYPQAGFSGLVAGPVQVSGSFTNTRDLRASGRFDVAASGDGVPVQGNVEVAYNGRNRSIQLGKSTLTLPHSTVAFNGTFGEKLQVRLQSTNLNDLLPAFAFTSDAPPEKLPIELRRGGSAAFEGTVTGPVDKAQVTGDVTLTNFEVAEQNIDRLVAKVDANASGVRASSVAVGQDTLRVGGTFETTLTNWRFTDDSALKGSLKVANARITKLLADAGQKLPIAGTIDAEAELSGTKANPEADLRFVVDQPVVYGQKFDRVRGRLRYQTAGVEVIDAVAEAGPARVLFSGTYQHPVNDLRNGTLKFTVSSEGWTLARIEAVQRTQTELAGRVNIKGSGTVAVRNGQVLPESIDGDITLNDLVVQNRAIGDFSVNARTTGRQLTVGMSGNLRGSKVAGNGVFELAGDYPGKGTVTFSPMSLTTVQDLALAATGREPLPVDGFVSGTLTFSGPLRKPELLRARFEMPSLEIVPARRALTPRQRTELTLRSTGPIVLEYDGKAVHVREAHMIGRETDIRIAGAILPAQKQPWDLKVNGNLNLGVLQAFHEDVVSSGTAIINASVRGTLQDPQVAGRMELKDASFYLADFPNGLDNINGVILFDQRRANIEKLTATTGGGDLVLSGFVGFGGNEFVYQLQARADRVRIRYPEGVSTTANAALTLAGTTSRSLLTGVVTIVRAGFNPRTDIASILASNPTPVGSPVIQNPFLRGMQFDVRVETVPNLQIQTSLTNNLQAEADLRLRGTAAKPVLLGRVVISQGEIQFFGNRYTINRGEIAFFNPVRIEPVLDLDLETRVRAVLVNIRFNGPLNRLNVSYRSDPPLQSTEIIALLTVGRAPGSNSVLASSQAMASQGVLGGGTNSLLGQAIAAPISSRLQRFFGVSRLKIDPQLTGLSAVPQARLTIEQQISRDVTLTYVTNLSQANQQIIRLEWNLSRNWSVVAVREENGVFGVDFFFKKRFR